MKVLVISSMFPNEVRPTHAVFVKNRIKHISAHCEVRVLSPIPWFPFFGILKKYAHRSSIPRRDIIDGLTVEYPRFVSPPGILKPLDGIFLFLTVWLRARAIRREFDFDLIDAHLAYPDGFGCALLARLLGKPLTVTLRGHDINELPRYPVRRRQVIHALKKADRVIGVADALRRTAVELGCPEENTVTISNGVDTDLFWACPRRDARERLGLPLDRKIVVSVGHLCERKGFHMIVGALAEMKERGDDVPYLTIVGGPGEERDYSTVIKDHIRTHGLESDVHMPGVQFVHDLRDWYNSADLFCLASSKEGWANVLLEALACGTPVVATNIWGTPEVINRDDYGFLVERDPKSIADGIRRALTTEWDRELISEYARSQTWERVAERVVETFREAIGVAAPSEETLSET